MKVNIIPDDFQAELPHLIDKDRFEVIETKEANTWIIRKKETKAEIHGPASSR